MVVFGTRGKTAQPAMINCTEGRPAVSQQNFLYYTHIKVTADSFNSIFKANSSVAGASTKQIGCQCQLFLSAGIHNGSLNKMCFKDTQRQQLHPVTRLLGEINQLNLTLQFVTSLIVTYFYRKVGVKSVNW
jgi:hypothetical protein